MRLKNKRWKTAHMLNYAGVVDSRRYVGCNANVRFPRIPTCKLQHEHEIEELVLVLQVANRDVRDGDGPFQAAGQIALADNRVTAPFPLLFLLSIAPRFLQYCQRAESQSRGS